MGLNLRIRLTSAQLVSYSLFFKGQGVWGSIKLKVLFQEIFVHLLNGRWAPLWGAIFINQSGTYTLKKVDFGLFGYYWMGPRTYQEGLRKRKFHLQTIGQGELGTTLQFLKGDTDTRWRSASQQR